ncbi:MAG: hypothetical protein HZC55_22035 [Verrucomicrobia bacterium]|nr:hypothetical protein [Verrucomicrobiota bacterium]
MKRGCEIGRGLLALAAILASLTDPASAAEIGEDIAVALPPFLVEEATKGPPWRHGEVLGFEILSRSRDATTRRVVEVHHRLHELLGELLPPELRLQFTVPRTLILYDEELQPASSQEVIRKMLQTTEPDSAGEPPPGPGSRGFRLPTPQRRYSFLPNLRLWDRDAMAVFMIVRRDDFDADRLSLTHDYIKYLLVGRVPALPLWFVTGFLGLYQKVHYDGDRISLEAMEWPGPVPADPAKLPPGVEPPVGPLAQLFQPPVLPSGPAPLAEATRKWQAHAALLVRWGLDADRQAHRAALWRFVEKCAAGMTSEATFLECFGFDYAEARRRLNAYLPQATNKDATFRLPRELKFPAFSLLNATEDQIARIKGDWERLEVPYVRNLSPGLAPKYLELARRTFRRAYDRDHRDPRLLAVMGLCEVDAGDEAAARDLLEAAARLGSLRPRANYELARLRFAALRASAPLDATQTATVLQPLFAAREALPPLPEVYELIAETWQQCAVKPTRGHLAVLDEGIRLFPRRPLLVRRAAELFLQHGFREEAAALIELGQRVAPDDATREVFAGLRAELEKPR